MAIARCPSHCLFLGSETTSTIGTPGQSDTRIHTAENTASVASVGTLSEPTSTTTARGSSNAHLIKVSRRSV